MKLELRLEELFQTAEIILVEKDGTKIKGKITCIIADINKNPLLTPILGIAIERTDDCKPEEKFFMFMAAAKEK